MEDFISFIVKHLVEKPESVRIDSLRKKMGERLLQVICRAGRPGSSHWQRGPDSTIFENASCVRGGSTPWDLSGL